MSISNSRKWLLTINNPLDFNFPHDIIKERLSKFKSINYWCMCDEIGGLNKVYHTHIFIQSKNVIRFDTLKRAFPPAHIDPSFGTAQDNYYYIRKQGKWVDTEKETTNLKDTFEEYGELREEHQGKRSDIMKGVSQSEMIYEMLKDGNSDYEILEMCPSAIKSLNNFNAVREVLKYESFKNAFRNLEVTYIYGDAGTGKTRYVMEKYGYSNVYRITDYKHPFDGYKGQDVVIFEEFRSSLSISDMLNYLDGYPLELPCRFMNKYACYTKVFIISNISLEVQYVSIQEKAPATWAAFLRRLHKIRYYTYKEIKEADITMKDGVSQISSFRKVTQTATTSTDSPNVKD